jgi:lysozyme
MAISAQGRDFVVRHEGFVSKAYRDPVGIWTIGTGFTNRSSVATSMIGKIGAGKTITREQNDRVLKAAFDQEYGPPVDRAMTRNPQHALDAGYSYCFNCGPGAMSDTWVGMWNRGLTFEAGERLKVSRVTAGGKPLKGLRNRRQAEAKLLTTGDYGAKYAPPPPSGYDEKLRELGYKRVIDFQRNHPNLVNDGILGPATRAQIDRDIAARGEGKMVGGAVGLAALLATVLPWVALAAVAGLAGWFVFRRREEITHWIKNRMD